jgi:hypothetical protein
VGLTDVLPPYPLCLMPYLLSIHIYIYIYVYPFFILYALSLCFILFPLYLIQAFTIPHPSIHYPSSLWDARPLRSPRLLVRVFCILLYLHPGLHLCVLWFENCALNLSAILFSSYQHYITLRQRKFGWLFSIGAVCTHLHIHTYICPVMRRNYSNFEVRRHHRSPFITNDIL